MDDLSTLDASRGFSPVIDFSRSRFWRFIIGPLVCLPRASITVYEASVLVSIALTIVLTLIANGLSTGLPIRIRTVTLDRLFSSLWTDPTAWNLVTAGAAAVAVFAASPRVVSLKAFSRVVASLTPFILLVIIYAAGDLFLKPAFAVARPISRIPEPPLTVLFRKLLGSNASAGSLNSMPSGFVIRQIGMFYFLMIAALNCHLPRGTRSWLRPLLVVLDVAGLLIVGFGRIYGGSHSALDVSVAIGIGTLLFWIIYLPPSTLISIRNAHLNRVYLSTLAAGVIVLFLVLLWFSQEAGKLVQMFAFTLIYLAIIFNLSPLLTVVRIRYVWPRSHHAGGRSVDSQ